MTRSGWQWDDYLTIEGETEESIRDRWRENADERVQRGLILRQFIEAERLSVEEADIDAALEKRLERFGDNEELREQLRSIFTEGSGFEMMSNDILMEKVNERIMAIAAGEAPELELMEEETVVASEEEE